MASPTLALQDNPHRTTPAEYACNITAGVRHYLARDTIEATLALPDAVEGGDTVRDYHDCQAGVWCHIVVLLLYEACGVIGGEPVDGTDLTEMHGLVSFDRQIRVHLEDAAHIRFVLRSRGPLVGPFLRLMRPAKAEKQGVQREMVVPRQLCSGSRIGDVLVRTNS